eukprot:12189966-Ditylum_brightwellii.AAC.1
MRKDDTPNGKGGHMYEQQKGEASAQPRSKHPKDIFADHRELLVAVASARRRVANRSLSSSTLSQICDR